MTLGYNRLAELLTLIASLCGFDALKVGKYAMGKADVHKEVPTREPVGRRDLGAWQGDT